MSDCIIWHLSGRSSGYGYFYRRGKRYAHRHVWEECFGPIPDGQHLHHDCGERACVNPGHLRLVTRKEHNQIHDASQWIVGQRRTITHCPCGHPYDKKNTIISRGRRYCRTCGNRRSRKRYYKRKLELDACSG